LTKDDHVHQRGAHRAVEATIVYVAPDIELETLNENTDLRIDLELDSIDLLNVVTAINEAAGIDIPDRDYGKIETIGAFATCLIAAEVLSTEVAAC
jgi:acyl carrier protein